MHIYTVKPVGFGANTYLLTADGKTAVAVDPAQPRILAAAEGMGLHVGAVLLTHGHFDHIGGCAALQREGAAVGCLAGEEELALRGNLGQEFGGCPVPPFRIDFTLRDGETRVLCGISFRAIATPGHTAGSCCYLASCGEEALFTGDTLFCGDVGRTDLPTGSAAALRASLKKLAGLSYRGPIYPGHGGPSLLERELAALL